MTKMLKKYSLVFVVLFSSMVSSCAFVNPPAGPGLIYTDSSELTYYDPYVKPNKKVVLCSDNLFGLFSWGDNGYDAFRMKSPIRKIATIEKTYYSRFFVYGESCMIIKGE